MARIEARAAPKKATVCQDLVSEKEGERERDRERGRKTETEREREKERERERGRSAEPERRRARRSNHHGGRGRGRQASRGGQTKTKNEREATKLLGRRSPKASGELRKPYPGEVASSDASLWKICCNCWVITDATSAKVAQ